MKSKRPSEVALTPTQLAIYTLTRSDPRAVTRAIRRLNKLGLITTTSTTHERNNKNESADHLAVRTKTKTFQIEASRQK